jgi:uncharacterized membrane protein
MDGWGGFLAATGFFLASHAVPTRPATRARLIAALGRRGFLIGYVALSLVALGWLIVEAQRAPYVALWDWAAWRPWAPTLAMPAVCLLIAAAVGAPNPLSFGGGRDDRFDADAPGIAGVARHPLLWALALWSGAHLLAVTSLSLAAMFGFFLVFSLAGMAAIDRRKRRAMGPEWGRLAARTSAVPFAALLDGRWRPRGGPSLARLGAGVALWAGLLALHAPVIGRSPLPPL